jgi:cell wall-associated NlpC family hydrolase
MINISFGQTYSNVNTVNLSKGNFLNKDVVFIKSEKEIIYEKLMSEVIKYLGTPYLYGGTTDRGIDCSAFVQSVYYFAFDIQLPRTSISQSTEGTYVEKDSLEFGDLIFFKTTRKPIGHVGIYLGSGYFVHSGRSKGVSVTRLDKEYYVKKYVKGMRIGLDIK